MTDVLITFGADTSAAETGMAGLGDTAATSLATIGSLAGQVAGQVGTMAAGISSGLGESVGAFADVDQKMANVRSIMSLTNDEFEQLRGLSIDISSELPTSTSEVADGFFQLASAGLTFQEIMTATKPIMDLAVASNTNFEVAANGVTAAMFQFGLSVEDANQIADTFQNTNVAFKTTMPEVAEALKFAGVTAAQLGLTFAQTATSIGLARNAGLGVTQAGTGLRATMAGIFNDSDKAKDAMAALGFELIKNEDGSLNLSATFATLQTGLSGISDKTERTRLLFDIFGREGSNVASILAENSMEFDILAEEMGRTGTTADAVTKQMEGFGNQMEAVSGTIVDQQAILGEQLAPAQLRVLKLKRDMLKAVNALPAPFIAWGGGIILVGAELGKMILPVIQAISQTGLLVLAIQAKIGATAADTVATGTQTGATVSATIAQSALNFAMLIFPGFLIVAAIVALVLAIIILVKNWDKVTAAFNRVKDAMLEYKTELLILLSLFVPFIGLPLLIIAEWDKVVAFFTGLGEFFVEITKFYVDIYATAWTAIFEFTTGLVGNIIGLVVDGFTSLVDLVLGPLLSLKDTILGVLTNLVAEAIGPIINIKDTIRGAFEDLTDDALEWGKDLVSNLVAGITDGSIIGDVVDGVKGIGDAVLSGLGFGSPVNPGMIQKGRELMTNLVTGIDDTVGEVADAVTGALTGTAPAAAAPAGGVDAGFRVVQLGPITLNPGVTRSDVDEFVEMADEALNRSGVARRR